MTQDQLQSDADMGVYAQQVLDNPAFKAALDRMRAQVVADWKGCPIRDREGQMLFLQAAKLTDAVAATLVGMIEQGKLASAHIDVDPARAERMEPAPRRMRRVR